MSYCAVCSRMARGFATFNTQYCSMECMNAHYSRHWSPLSVPIDPIPSTIPLDYMTKEQALAYIHATLQGYQDKARATLNLPPVPFTPLDKETLYIQEVLETVNPTRPPKEVAEMILKVFRNACSMEIPF